MLFAKDLETIYLEGGITAVRDAIETNLQTKEYWQRRLGNRDLKYGYYDKPVLITVVDKTAKKLELVSYNDGNLTSNMSHEVITGLMGDKLKEGDLKTPVGVYKITRRFTPSDDYYGPVAFNLSYPNLYDKLRGKTGSGIWIHGFPPEGDERIDSEKTKGCVVLKNQNLKLYEAAVGDKSSIVIINESGKKTSTTSQIATIFSELFKWKMAWTISDTEAYFSFYDDNFIRFDGMKIGEFKSMKRSIFAKKEGKYIQFTDFEIVPYPSADNKGNLFEVSFHQKYLTQTYKFDGEKTLLIRLDNDKMKILAEK